MGFLNTLAKQLMQQATITAVQRIAAHAYRLTLTGPALATWEYQPEEHIQRLARLVLPVGQRRARR